MKKNNKKNKIKYNDIKRLKGFINNLPEEMGEFTVVNGEVGYLDVEDENSAVYRLDNNSIIC
jgi:hypothetical protein